jgi:hypothetical protein
VVKREVEKLSAKYCRRQAEACLRLAEHRWSSKARQRTRDAAAVWEQLAREAEQRAINHSAARRLARNVQASAIGEDR